MPDHDAVAFNANYCILSAPYIGLYHYLSSGEVMMPTLPGAGVYATDIVDIASLSG